MDTSVLSTVSVGASFLSAKLTGNGVIFFSVAFSFHMFLCLLLSASVYVFV